MLWKLRSMITAEGHLAHEDFTSFDLRNVSVVRDFLLFHKRTA